MRGMGGVRFALIGAGMRLKRALDRFVDRVACMLVLLHEVDDAGTRTDGQTHFVMSNRRAAILGSLGSTVLGAAFLLSPELLVSESGIPNRVEG